MFTYFRIHSEIRSCAESRMVLEVCDLGVHLGKIQLGCPHESSWRCNSRRKYFFAWSVGVSSKRPKPRDHISVSQSIVDRIHLHMRVMVVEGPPLQECYVWNVIFWCKDSIQSFSFLLVCLPESFTAKVQGLVMNISVQILIIPVCDVEVPVIVLTVQTVLWSF